MENFINSQEIENLLEKHKNPDKLYIREILDQTKDANHCGLDLEQMAALLQNTDKELEHEIFATAKQIVNDIYGDRRVLFAPLYVSSECKNSCSYCGFRCDNPDMKRKTLNDAELKEEVDIIERMGHKRLLMVWGESDYDAYKLADQIAVAYAVKTEPHGDIRRINVNLAPMSVADFKILKSGNIGTYQCFQETYHKPTYKQVHTKGVKRNFEYRLNVMNRALEAGIEDFGIGALYGLYDYKFETMAVLKHTLYLEERYNVGPHTISFPRIEPAHGSELSYNPPYAMTDEQLKRTVAILRLAVPYTGMIISTRENAAMRNELLKLGISQLSAASKVYPGGYKASLTNKHDEQQFTVGDDRSLEQVISGLMEDGYIPSFCTGCYRLNRTGEHFQLLARQKFMSGHCTPNGINTFAEYLMDYAPLAMQERGLALIERMLPLCRKPVEARADVAAIIAGQRDLYR